MVVLDMDRTEIPVYGRQKTGAYDGHFEPTCYHPLLLLNGQGGGKTAPGQRPQRLGVGETNILAA